MQSGTSTQVSKDTQKTKRRPVQTFQRTQKYLKVKEKITRTHTDLSQSAPHAPWSSAFRLVRVPLSLRRLASLKVLLASSLALEDNFDTLELNYKRVFLNKSEKVKENKEQTGSMRKTQLVPYDFPGETRFLLSE